MVHQAEVNTNGKAKAPPNVAASFSHLAHDAIELAELQAKLLKLDAQVAARNGGMSLALIVVAVCLLLGCVTIALVALAEVLVAEFEWSRAGAFAASAAIGFALSGIVGTGALFRVKKALAALERSRNELNRNIAWIKSNLKRGNAESTSPSPAARSFSNQ
jgi:hypothetical protein